MEPLARYHCFYSSKNKNKHHNNTNNVFYKKNKFWEELIAYFPRYDTGHIENDASNSSSIVACVFVTAVTFLPSRYLATIGGFLPSRYLATIGGTQTHTQTAT
jgi:hypothetical protein